MSKTNGKFCYVYDHNFLKKEQKDMLQVNISLGREGERQKGLRGMEAEQKEKKEENRLVERQRRPQNNFCYLWLHI